MNRSAIAAAATALCIAGCDAIFGYAPAAAPGARDGLGPVDGVPGGDLNRRRDGSSDGAIDADIDASADSVTVPPTPDGAPTDGIVADAAAPKPDALVLPDGGPPADGGPGITGPCALYANWSLIGALTYNCRMGCGIYEMECFDSGSRCGCWISGTFQRWCYGYSYTGCVTVGDALGAGCCG